MASDRPSEDGDRGVIVSGVLNDIHSLGLYVTERALALEGYKIVRLGTMVTQEEFIDAARETAADALLCSSSNGMAQVDFEGFGDKCREAGLGELYIYAGGMLTLRQEEWPAVEEKLGRHGVRQAFKQGTSLKEILTAITGDLGTKERASSHVGLKPGA